ncbi:MAG TPA: NPCBM/NEW2 domain-containing protein [Planctomycetaceae bacterium]|nr:NPCBM/NEW2 domain-containing protein [Planctomycetaceae bacterium]
MLRPFWLLVPFVLSATVFAIEEVEVDDGDEAPAAAAPAVAAPAAAPGQPPNAGGKPGQPGQPMPNGQPAPKPPAVAATTVEDKQGSGDDAELKDGVLTVKAMPPLAVPLDELQNVVFHREVPFVAEWVGQENRDFVQIGAATGSNGIQDVHLRVSGLADKPVKQVQVLRRSPPRVWRRDVAQSPHWLLHFDRIGQADAADIYFEPPTEDLSDVELELLVTYQDDSNANAKVKATGHTSDQAKYDASTPAATRRVIVRLDGGDQLNGQIHEGEAEELTLQCAWPTPFAVPLVQIRGILFDGAPAEAQTRYNELIAKPTDEDVVLASGKDGGVTEISGRLQGLSPAGLKLLFDGQTRNIKLERVQGVVLAAHPPVPWTKGAFQVFRLRSGDTLSGLWTGFTAEQFEFKTPWGKTVQLPRATAAEITGRNGKLVPLSELTPVNVEQTAYFDRLMPWIRDSAWNGRPLKMDGKTYTKGLAVHSRCVLTYALDGDFATFKALVGFEEEAGSRGRVKCRVLADGKELFARPDLRPSDKPQTIEAPIAGVK